jgi:transposase-like protein
MPLLAIYTDACKGLEETVKFVFPMAEQRECFKHLMDNYVKYKDVEHMYPAGRVYRKDVYVYHMNHVYAILKTKWYLYIYITLSNGTGMDSIQPSSVTMSPII